MGADLATLSLAETMELSLALGDKIDVLWNVFITVHFGIFTLYYFISRAEFELFLLEKLVCSISYTVFLFLNGNALRVSYMLLEGIDRHIVKILQTYKADHFAFKQIYIDLDFTTRPTLILITHFSLFVSINFAIYLSRYIIQRRKHLGSPLLYN